MSYRVDTTYLSEDLHAKVPGILSKLKNYGSLTESILATPIKKSKSIFNNKKITDHHAIIPTGEIAQGLQGSELSIYDLICRRFIAVFYPPCIVSNTTVMGKVDQLDFKTTGKQIIEPGWRKVYSENDLKIQKSLMIMYYLSLKKEEALTTILSEGKTSPKQYTEATLLVMETAGKYVEDESKVMRKRLPAINRANIIETLFKRNYIEEKKTFKLFRYRTHCDHSK